MTLGQQSLSSMHGNLVFCYGNFFQYLQKDMCGTKEPKNIEKNMFGFTQMLLCARAEPVRKRKNKLQVNRYMYDSSIKNSGFTIIVVGALKIVAQ